jgi:O-antigen/teichoic acid export membrane protein
MSWPYHQVPDGSALLPHHFTWAMILVLVPIAVVWDNHRGREPVVVATAVAIGLVAFLLVWPRYPRTGAAVAVATNVLAVVALSWHLASDREVFPWPWIAAALGLSLVALDDVLQHAFGWPMPLDWLWKNGLRELLTLG